MSIAFLIDIDIEHPPPRPFSLKKTHFFRGRGVCTQAI